MMSSSAAIEPSVSVVEANVARALAVTLLEEAGVAQPAAQSVAGELVDADLRGVMTHGFTRLPLYLGGVANGSIDGNSSPTVVLNGPSALLVDAEHGFGHHAGRLAMREAIELSNETGIAAATVLNSTHFGAAGGYARMAAEADCIGIVVSNSPPLLPAVNGTERRVGNNPLAIACPTDQGFPLVYDVAMSVVSSWKIQMAYERGEPIPDGWAYDSAGNPTNDSYEAFAGGGLLRAVGDHKGFGLAMMIEILTAGLSGGGMTNQVRRLVEPGAMNTCHTFIAISPDRFAGSDNLRARAGELCTQIWESPRRANVDRLLVPGQLEHESSVDRERNGIPYPEQIWRPVAGIAESKRIEHPFSGR